MKIVFLSTNFPPDPGGIAELSARLSEQFADRGHELTVLTHRPATFSANQTVKGYRVSRAFAQCPVTTTRSVRNFLAASAWRSRAQRAILKRVQQLEPDVVLLGNYQSILSGGVVKRLRCPYFLYFHGGELAAIGRSLMPGRRATLRRSIEGAWWTFCNGSFSLGLVRDLCGPAMTRTSATGCGVPLDRITESPDRRGARRRLGWEDEPVLLTVARLVENKGVDNVIKALPLVRQQLPGCRYVVAGDGPMRCELQRLAGELGLGRAVVLMGYVSNAVRDALYEAADLYVMTSRRGRFNEIEGFGITFLEANACGLAAVGSRVGGIPDAVEDGVNGVLVPPDDPSALAAAVGQLMAQPKLRLRLARGGQQRIRARFNWPVISAHIEQKLFEAVAIPRA